VKFGALRERAVTLGFDAVATGHYARTRLDEDGRWHLHRSADPDKDQSYVLARTGQDEIATSRFPVGGQTKEETRALARELGLRTADKPDSYEICFVADGNAARFVERSIDITPGEIVGTDGAVLGEHAGIHNFTVGQRRGLGINTGSARAYVLEIDAPRNRVVVGPDEMLARGGLEAERVRWIAGEPPAEIDAVQVRAHGAVHRARLLDVSDDRATVRFIEPQRAIAPGQLVAFYVGDEVLGGGTIVRATSPS
jgi:tRNA-specific 2-thiouridylase